MLPAEIEQFTLILPAPSDHAGTVQAARFTIAPSHEITVAATGDRLLPESITETVKNGRREIKLPHPSSPGLIDAEGATITNWWYTVTTAIMVNGRWQDLPSHRIVQPLPGTETVNLALIPDQEAPQPPEIVTPTEWAIIARDEARQARDEAQDAASDALGSAGAADAAAAIAGSQAAAAGAARTGAETARDAAQLAKTDAAASATASAGSATAAAGSATAAAGSATAAAGSATAAAGSATAAGTALAGAETAKTAAQTAKTEAEAARDLALAGQFVGALLGTVDLNTVKTPGIYKQDTGGAATVGRNYPIAGALGVLEVTAINSTNQVQKYTIQQGAGAGYPVTWIRRCVGTAWGPWTQLTTQRIVRSGVGVYVGLWDSEVNRETGVMAVGVPLGTANLNDVVADGVYTAFASEATTALNYPKNGISWIVEIIRISNNSLIQRAVPHSGGTINGGRGFWQRRLNGTVWDAWGFYSTLRADTAAGRTMTVWNEVEEAQQQIYGDTGWRNISNLLLNGWALAAGGIVRIRRVGSVVSLVVANLSGAAATGAIVLDRCPGFHHGDWLAFQSALFMGQPNRLVTHRGNTQGAGLLAVEGGASAWPTWNNTGGVRDSWTWMTMEPWPTSLPGTAIGSIPTN